MIRKMEKWKNERMAIFYKNLILIDIYPILIIKKKYKKYLQFFSKMLKNYFLVSKHLKFYFLSIYSFYMQFVHLF